MFRFLAKKRVILLAVVVFVLILGVGGFFYWQNQKDVRELNKTLPKGVMVEKSLFGNEYEVVNKIDGYEFKVPREWRRVGSVDYYFESEKNANRMVLEGPPVMVRDLILIDRYKEEIKELKSWVTDLYRDLSVDLEKTAEEYGITEEQIGKYKVVKVSEGSPILGVSYFFQSKSITYEIRSVVWSEESIREIILNWKW